MVVFCESDQSRSSGPSGCFVLLYLLLQLAALGAEPVIRANLSVATTTVDQPVELQIEIQNARIIDPPEVAAVIYRSTWPGNLPDIR